MAISFPEPTGNPIQDRNNLQFWIELERLNRMVLTGKTAAPGITDDKGDSIEIGTLWVDETNNNAYICEDNASGAAVWAQID